MYAAPTHRPNAVATKKRYRRANVHGIAYFFFADAYTSFVGAAYMPPGRGVPCAEFAGKLPVYSVL